jgi:hypothetical protein
MNEGRERGKEKEERKKGKKAEKGRKNRKERKEREREERKRERKKREKEGDIRMYRQFYQVDLCLIICFSSPDIKTIIWGKKQQENYIL